MCVGGCGRMGVCMCVHVCASVFFWFGLDSEPQASAPITSGMHTDGGAVKRKPGSFWFKGTPQWTIDYYFLVVESTQLARQLHQERTQMEVQ